jgi:hypothetical protein
MEPMGAESDQRRRSDVESDEHADVGCPSEPHRRGGYGYVNEHFMMKHSELAAMRRGIVECAVTEGCDLAAIYIERVETSPAAWRALQKKLSASSDPNVLIVPGLHHLATAGHPAEVRNALLGSGTKVLIALTRASADITIRSIPAPRR